MEKDKILIKTCLKCSKKKPVAQFGKHEYNDDGYQIWCNTCNAKYQVNYYTSHYEAITDKRKQKRQHLQKILTRAKVLNPCPCGEDEPLCLTLYPLSPDVPKPDLTNVASFRKALNGSSVLCYNCRVKLDSGLIDAPVEPLQWDRDELEPEVKVHTPRPKKEKPLPAVPTGGDTPMKPIPGGPTPGNQESSRSLKEETSPIIPPRSLDLDPAADPPPARQSIADLPKGVPQ